MRFPIFSNGDHIFLPASTCEEFELELPNNENPSMPTRKFYHSQNVTTNYTVSGSLTKIYRLEINNGPKIVNHQSTARKGTETFDPSNLRKLHMQTKHGSTTAMKECITAAGLWSEDFESCIE